MLRPPVLVWKLLLSDLWRLLALSATALVVVIAFAAAVRPLATGQLGPLSAAKFMLLAIPPMLQFALPFAAGFAATLAYHRFAGENEALAAHAGGVSHRSLIMPAAITGLLVAGALAVLTNDVIPRFYRAMETLVSRDATGIIIGGIERGEAVEVGDLLIHADQVHRRGPDPAIGAAERLILTGVVAVETHKDGSLGDEYGAERAEVWIFPRQGGDGEATEVRIRLHGADHTGADGVAARGDFLIHRSFPHGVASRIKFLTSSELEAQRARPDATPQVDRRRRALAAALGEWFAVQEIRAALATEGRIMLLGGADAVGGADADQRLALRAASVARDGARWRVNPVREGGPIEIDRRQAGALHRHTARRAWLTLRTPADGAETLVDVEFEGFATPDAQDAARSRLEYAGRRLANDPAPSLFAADSFSLLRTSADLLAGADAIEPDAARRIERARTELVERIALTRRDITGNRHERFALPVACLVMTLTGAVMALRLRDSLPLPVYLWSFFPALAAVVSISGGESLVRDHLQLGLIVLWGGVVGLAAYTLVVFLELRRR